MLNKNERILLWSSNIWNLADGMLGPLLAVFTEKVGGDILDISWVYATFLIVTGVLVIFIGKISDGLDKRKMLVIGYLLTALATFGYIFVSTTAHLIVIQVLLAISVALSNPTWYALYDKYSGKNNDGYIWGLSDGQTKIVSGVAIIIGGFVVKEYSFNTLFIIMGTIFLIATLYQSKMLFTKA